MAMKKTIAIVGATEKSGKEIVMKFASMPYRLLLISNEITALDHLKNDLFVMHPFAEIETLDCVKDGCWEADIIILAVSPEVIQQVAEGIKEVATQKIVVDVFNTKDNIGELKKILPYSKLVGISGNLSSEIIISGDDKTANEEIQQIFILAGFTSTEQLQKNI
jgi:predicted dinucleotide-binding enzyme